MKEVKGLLWDATGYMWPHQRLQKHVYCVAYVFIPPHLHIPASPIHKQSLPDVSSKTQGTWWLNTESTRRWFQI